MLVLILFGYLANHELNKLETPFVEMPKEKKEVQTVEKIIYKSPTSCGCGC